MEILCFFAGIVFYYLKSIYALIFIAISLIFRPKLRFLLWFLSAILWAIFHEWSIADQGMPKAPVMKRATIYGYVDSIPVKRAYKTQFQFVVEQLNSHPVKTTIQLSCYQHCPEIHAGEQWAFIANIKKPVNLANPGGFDYVGFLSSRHIPWVGTIHSKHIKRFKTSKKNHLMRFRETIAKQLAQLIPEEDVLGIFEALTLGLTNHISPSQWDLFRRTGTTHLIDISGEHIALVAGLSYWLFKWLWTRMGRLCLYYPAPKIAGAAAIVVSLSYALIAGFAVPTQRSLISCFLMLLSHFRSHKLNTWQSWRYALFGVLLLEPHAVLMLGFYFSFLAVAILILVNQRFQYHGFYKLLTLQLACMLGLMPLSLYWFSYASLNGLIANLIAIPWVSFMIVPLALWNAFFNQWLSIPYSVDLLQWLIKGLLIGLHWIDTFESINVQWHFNEFLSPLSLMIALCCILLLPLKQYVMVAGLILFSSFFPHHEPVAQGEATIDVLDVGQGLAVLVRTAHHTLMYDTGIRFFHSNDMATLVIIPYLKRLGITHIDTVVISHPDLDHQGGLASLQRAFPIQTLLMNEASITQHSQSCHDAQEWEWDGIRFRFFPIRTPLRGKNNHSCILQIINRTSKMLLTGDIEQTAETYLLKTYGKQLQSTVMLIPHHLSKTSSSPNFVHQVNPQYAIASYGFDNRYHFPHLQAIKTYEKEHISIFNTMDCGMVTLHLQSKMTKPSCYKKNNLS